MKIKGEITIVPYLGGEAKLAGRLNAGVLFPSVLYFDPAPAYFITDGTPVHDARVYTALGDLQAAIERQTTLLMGAIG